MRYKVTLERCREVLESAEVEVKAGSKKEAEEAATEEAEELDGDEWTEFDVDFVDIRVEAVELLGPEDGETPLAFPWESPEEKESRWRAMIASSKAGH